MTIQKALSVRLQKAAKQLKGFNVHSATTIVENWEDMGLSKMSIEEATKYWNDEMLDSVTVEQMQAVKVLFDNKAVKLVSGGKGTMHDFRQPVKVNEVKGYPYEIEAQIDREPFRILMKKPIFFDTSY